MRLCIAICAGAVVAAIGAWTVLAGRLFVWMGGLSTYFPSPWATWWRYACQPRIDGSTLTYLIMSAVAAAVPIVLLGALVIYFLRPKKKLVRPLGGGLRQIEAGVTSNHGHAAFATPAQTAQRFSGRGCLIGATDRSENALLLFDRINAGPGHSMIFAGPGSHKTTSAITRIWNWRGPRVVFDPSCEIGPIMTPALSKAGFNVTSIGLTGEGINALDWIDSGPLFRSVNRHRQVGAQLDAGSVSAIFRAMALEAVAKGLKLSAAQLSQISGHSTRIGACQDMVRYGTDIAGAMQAGRWKSDAMVARYCEGLDLKRGAVAMVAQKRQKFA